MGLSDRGDQSTGFSFIFPSADLPETWCKFHTQMGEEESYQAKYKERFCIEHLRLA